MVKMIAGVRQMTVLLSFPGISHGRQPLGFRLSRLPSVWEGVRKVPDHCQVLDGLGRQSPEVATLISTLQGLSLFPPHTTTTRTLGRQHPGWYSPAEILEQSASRKFSGS